MLSILNIKLIIIINQTNTLHTFLNSTILLPLPFWTVYALVHGRLHQQHVWALKLWKQTLHMERQPHGNTRTSGGPGFQQPAHRSLTFLSYAILRCYYCYCLRSLGTLACCMVPSPLHYWFPILTMSFWAIFSYLFIFGLTFLTNSSTVLSLISLMFHLFNMHWKVPARYPFNTVLLLS